MKTGDRENAGVNREGSKLGNQQRGLFPNLPLLQYFINRMFPRNREWEEGGGNDWGQVSSYFPQMDRLMGGNN